MKQSDITPPLAGVISDALEVFASLHSNLKGESLRALIPRQDRKKRSKPVPYLYRNFLAGKEVPVEQPGLLLHKFVSSDLDGELHNHPWRWSVSFILTGRYREHRSTPRNKDFKKKKQILFKPPTVQEFGPGDHNFIAANDFHRVELLTDEVWTLFLHGPRTQTWGFAPEVFGEKASFKIIKNRTFRSRKRVRNA